MAQQLGLALPSRVARGRDDFLVAPANAMAVAMIENWRNWHGAKLVLSGPEGAGKTHLVHVWADAAQAQIIAATNVHTADVPDLASRMRGTLEAGIDAPDDALLSAVLAKLLADRQLVPRTDVIPYLLNRMDRSFAAARRIVAALDAESLARKRPITRALAGDVLDKDRPDTP